VQTVDLPAYIMGMGWPRERIRLIDMDAGVSGTKKIDERPGMKYLFELIVSDQIGAVASEDEDRLFRDVSQIQVNIFIEACRLHHVLVITPTMIYDFAHQHLGDYHARQFRFKCEMAAEYIKMMVKGKLLRAKRHMNLEGRWVGTSIAPGYMIDERKTLPDNSVNPDWRRLAIFEAMAEVICRYFQIFIETGGCVYRTMRIIERSGPYYPDPSTWQIPPGFRIPGRQYKDWGRGCFPACIGLERMFTNVTYIGHWTVENVVVRYNNHPAIIDFQDFMKAFNFLSPVTLEGRSNPDYKPFRQHARPKPEAERNVEPPLLRGLLVSPIDGEMRNVGSNWVGDKSHYVYKVHETSAIRTYEWTRVAAQVDDVVVKQLHEKLRATFAPEVWDRLLSQFDQKFEQERRRIVQQIAALQRVIKGIKLRLRKLDEEELIEDAEAQFREAKAEGIRLNAALERANDERAKFDAILALKDNCGPSLENWPNLAHGAKVNIVCAFIRRIEATAIDDNGLNLVIFWRDDSSDEALVVRQSNGADGWLHADVTQLIQLVDSGASQVEIAAAFPTRRWEHIRRRYNAERPDNPLYVDPQPIQYLETYNAYLQRISNEKVRATRGERWTTSDKMLLQDLVDKGARADQIASAFPTRRWVLIRTQIKKLCGKGVVISGAGELRRDETFADYLTRTGKSADEYDLTVLGVTSIIHYLINSKSHPSERDRVLGRTRVVKPLNLLELMP
jgi:hypothetical protein